MNVFTLKTENEVAEATKRKNGTKKIKLVEVEEALSSIERQRAFFFQPEWPGLGGRSHGYELVHRYR